MDRIREAKELSNMVARTRLRHWLELRVCARARVRVCPTSHRTERRACAVRQLWRADTCALRLARRALQASRRRFTTSGARSVRALLRNFHNLASRLRPDVPAVFAFLVELQELCVCLRC